MTIVKRNNHLYEINQPQSNAIFDFVDSHYDKNNPELVNIFRLFKTKNYAQTIQCTFNQDFAFNNKNIEYISAYHPLINAASNYFQDEKIDTNTVFRFALDKNLIPDREFNELFADGFYFLVKFSFEITKIINGKESKFIHLKSLAMDLNGEEFKLYDNERSEFFTSVCQDNKLSIPQNGIINFNIQLTEEIKRKYTEFVLVEKDSIEQIEKLKFDSELNRKTDQEISDIDKRIKRLKKNIVEGRGIEVILKAEIKELENKKVKLKELNKQSKISVNSKLVSLNFIYIYG